ncbi:MAG: HAD family hydrolase [Leptolyngbyaceae bacterium]|nr:HAD family hydrolase [Leptolyngbyaceae bacterium]
MNWPNILAFDFDGVICDGLVEYFQTAWKAYCQIWNPTPSVPPKGLAERFYPLRPVIETGWEMPMLLRSLLLGVTDEEVLADWQAIAHRRIDAEGLNPVDLARAVDGVRDEWIREDTDEWLAQHRFYPGVIARLRRCLEEVDQCVIISTKEGRFIQTLLEREQVAIAPESIYGKEVRQPKHETLRQLTAQYQETTAGTPQLWFIEDRLKTLESVKEQADLDHVTLFLADWGYNTEGDRDRAAQGDRLHLLTSDIFAKDFDAWVAGHP